MVRAGGTGFGIGNDFLPLRFVMLFEEFSLGVFAGAVLAFDDYIHYRSPLDGSCRTFLPRPRRAAGGGPPPGPSPVDAKYLL